MLGIWFRSDAIALARLHRTQATQTSSCQRRWFSPISKAQPRLVNRDAALRGFLGPTVAIVGRPNVGKSTCFNRFAGSQLAIVDKFAGVTRDRKVGQAKFQDLKFVMVDTPGFMELTKQERKQLGAIQTGMVRQAEIALDNADLALFLVDAREGITSDDRAFAKWLRDHIRAPRAPQPAAPKQTEDDIDEDDDIREDEEEHSVVGAADGDADGDAGFQVLLVANKCEALRKGNAQIQNDILELGFGEPTCISALHKEGFGDLYVALKEAFDKLPPHRRRPEPILDPSVVSTNYDPHSVDKETSLLQLAFVGRPNVGKSTLTNALIARMSPPSTTLSHTPDASPTRSDPSSSSPPPSSSDLPETSSVSNTTGPSEGGHAAESSNPSLVDERVLTGPTPGITRDSVSINLMYKDQLFKLVDTAGVIGSNRMSWRKLDKPSSLAMDATIHAIDYANVVCLVCDVSDRVFKSLPEDVTESLAERQAKARKGRTMTVALPRDIRQQVAESVFTKKDRSLAEKIFREGRSLLIVLNKWDLLSEVYRPLVMKAMQGFVDSITASRGGQIKIVPLSAKEGENVDQLLPEVLGMHEKWNSRVSTSKLNRWLHEMFRSNPPPSVGGKEVKIKFVTQVKARPPTFALFTSRQVPESYKKFLQSSLRTEFELGGIPVRLLIREKVNPFAPGGEQRIPKSPKRNVALSSIASTGVGENKDDFRSSRPPRNTDGDVHSERSGDGGSGPRPRRNSRRRDSALLDRSLDRKHKSKAAGQRKRLNVRPPKRSLSRKR